MKCDFQHIKIDMLHPRMLEFVTQLHLTVFVVPHRIVWYTLLNYLTGEYHYAPLNCKLSVLYFDVLLIWASCVYIISYCRGRFHSPCYAFWHIFSWNTSLASLSGIPTSVLRLLVSTCTRGHADLEACWAHSLHTVERDTCGERRQILESGWTKFPPSFCQLFGNPGIIFHGYIKIYQWKYNQNCK